MTKPTSIIITLIVAAALAAGVVVAGWLVLRPDRRPAAVTRPVSPPAQRTVRGGVSAPARRPAPTPAPAPQTVSRTPASSVSRSAAHLLPPGPLLFVSLEDLDRVLKVVGRSKWWGSIWPRLQTYSRVAHWFKHIRERYGQMTRGRDLPADLAEWRQLFGRQVCAAVYLRPGTGGRKRRSAGLVVAFTPPSGQTPDQILDWMRRLVTSILGTDPKLESSLIGQHRIRTLRWEDAAWHLAMPAGRLVVMTNHRPLLAEIIARSSGAGGERLTGDPLYRGLTALPPEDKVLALFVRFERVLPFLVGSLRGDDLPVRIARSVRSVQVCSNGLESRVAVSFKPGAVTSILGPGQGGGGMRTLDLLPASPLVYLGLRGPGWLQLWRRLGWEMGLGQGDRQRIDRRVEKTLGLPGLEDFLGLFGREAALAVIDFPRSGLPIPETLAYVELRDESTADRRLPWLINVLKRRGGDMLFRTQRLGEMTVYHTVTPMVGTISAVAWGPYFVVSNELNLLQDVVGRKRASPSFFWARMRRHASANLLAAVDVGRISDLAPRLWPHLAGLARLRRLKLRSIKRWFLTATDWARVLRAVVFWSTWDGRAERLTLGLRLWLEDTPIKRGPPVPK